MTRIAGAVIVGALVFAAGGAGAQVPAPVIQPDPVAPVACAPCGGEGATYCSSCSGSGREICPACDGTGVMQLGIGPVACSCGNGWTGRACMACRGQAVSPCAVCGGAGAFGGPEPRRWIDLAGYRFHGPYTSPYALADYPGVLALAFLDEDDLWYILNVATSGARGVGTLFKEDAGIQATLADPASSGLILGAAVFYARDGERQGMVAKEVLSQYSSESGP